MEECIDALEAGFGDMGTGNGLEAGRSDVYTATRQSALFHRNSRQQ